MNHDQHGGNANNLADAQATTAAQVASADQTPTTASGQSTREIIAALFAPVEVEINKLLDQQTSVSSQVELNKAYADYLTEKISSIAVQNRKIEIQAKMEAAINKLHELRVSGCKDLAAYKAALAEANPTPKRKPKDDSPKVFKKLLKEEYADNNGNPDYTQGHNGTLKGTPPAGKKYYKLASGKPDDNYYRDATPTEIAEMTKTRDDWLEANGRADESSRATKA
jgi:hypothetical protein